MRDLKVGVVGCGIHAQTHFKEIAKESRVHLTAIADINPDRLDKSKTEHRPDMAFNDYREMLATVALDLVYIITTPGHLLSIVLDCLEEGLNVSVEKPPGMNLAETKLMAKAARKSSGKAMVSFNRRYKPEILAVRQMAQKNGGPVHVSATYNKPLTDLYMGTPSTVGIYPDPLTADSIHHVDLLRWLASSTAHGAALPVAVYSEVQDGKQPGAHRHNASIRFDNDCIGTLMSHFGVGMRIQRAEIHADDLSAYLDLTDKQPKTEVYTASSPRAEQYEGNWRPSWGKGVMLEKPLNLDSIGGPDFNETRHFVDCILNNENPWSDLDDSVHTMHLCKAIRDGHKGKLPFPVS